MVSFKLQWQNNSLDETEILMDHTARIQNLTELVLSEGYLQNRQFDIQYNESNDSFTIKFACITNRQKASLENTLFNLDLFHVKVEAVQLVKDKKRRRYHNKK